MKNISTPINNLSSVSSQDYRQKKPSDRAIGFVRQFARVYQASRLNTPALSGIILN